MKPIYLHLCGALALTFTIAACVPAPDSTPAPTPRPTQVPVTVTPAPPPAPPPPAANWIDRPQTPGEWNYAAINSNPTARFSSDGRLLFSLVCQRNSRRIGLMRESAGIADGATMTVRTETADRALPTQGGSSGSGASAVLGTNDPLLDAMALTRGRFAVEIDGAAPLYLPAWAEVTRVIEDCR